jgi:hypothetical protein
MGKIMECGGICAIPKGKVILATVKADNFELLPMDPNTRCTELSVAAHTLYEKSERIARTALGDLCLGLMPSARPDLLSGPGGVLDITNARYEQISERAVRVSGAVIQRKPTVSGRLQDRLPRWDQGSHLDQRHRGLCK